MLPARGCCTDGPGCEDVATVRQVYRTLTVVLGAAVLAIGTFNFFFH